MSVRRLRRSRSDRLIAGVCGGLGDYTGIDPTVIRAIWGVTSVIAGTVFTGALVYLLFWVIVPEAHR